METRIREIDDAIWEDFKAAARERKISANSLLLECIEREAKKWRKDEDARILRRADEIRQRKLDL